MYYQISAKTPSWAPVGVKKIYIDKLPSKNIYSTKYSLLKGFFWWSSHHNILTTMMEKLQKLNSLKSYAFVNHISMHFPNKMPFARLNINCSLNCILGRMHSTASQLWDNWQLNANWEIFSQSSIWDKQK